MCCKKHASESRCLIITLEWNGLNDVNFCPEHGTKKIYDSQTGDEPMTMCTHWSGDKRAQNVSCDKLNIQLNITL